MRKNKSKKTLAADYFWYSMNNISYKTIHSCYLACELITKHVLSSSSLLFPKRHLQKTVKNRNCSVVSEYINPVSWINVLDLHETNSKYIVRMRN